jgi:hypothetical protein
MYRAENGGYRNGTDFNANLLTGCSAAMAGGDYTISVTPATGANITTYNAIAQPTATGHQSNDYSFQIDQNQTEYYLPSGSNQWLTNVTWASLR